MRRLSILALILTGCVSVAPNLKIPEKKCPDLPPVPNKVHLSIDGDKIDADAGGALLLRGYVSARDAK